MKVNITNFEVETDIDDDGPLLGYLTLTIKGSIDGKNFDYYNSLIVNYSEASNVKSLKEYIINRERMIIKRNPYHLSISIECIENIFNLISDKNWEQIITYSKSLI